MATLVVNADDYGLTAGTSRAIVRAHLDGVVTSTSVLTLAPAFTRTTAWLDDAPGLGVGLHLAAVGEDPPLLTASEVPSLVDRKGRLALSSLKMVPRLAAGRIDPADLEREFTAQYEAFVSTGRAPTHLDTHHNLHLWPMVADVVTRLATTWSVPAVRVPWSRARSPIGAGVRHLGRRLRHRADGAGLWHPDVYYGIDEGGRLDTEALLALVDLLPQDPTTTIEVAVHPGEHGDADLSRYPWPGACRDAELEALMSPLVLRRVRAGGHRLVPYGPHTTCPPHRHVAVDLAGGTRPDLPSGGPDRDGTLTA